MQNFFKRRQQQQQQQQGTINIGVGKPSGSEINMETIHYFFYKFVQNYTFSKIILRIVHMT